MEEKKPIGLILKELRKEKRITGVELGDRLGMSKQAVFDTFNKRQSMTLAEMENWATALEVPVQELLNRVSGKYSLKREGAESTSFGEDVLHTIKRMLEEEMKEKNDQIRALQKALDQAQQIQTVLLGKSLEYSDCSIISMYPNGLPAIAEA